MQLIYLSPVAWSSFAQRPHKFVEWFHRTTGKNVLWIEPYPTRFPVLADFSRSRVAKGNENDLPPNWLTVLSPKAIPIEPIPASGIFNGILWGTIIRNIKNFISDAPTMIVIGKPSVLALTIIHKFNELVSIYDAMDDFSSFYTGYSRWAMSNREKKMVKRVSKVWVSSTRLQQRWSKIKSDVCLVPNGLDEKILPVPNSSVCVRDTKVFGYIGTMGMWFDWSWVTELAKARPNDVIKLIGPLFAPPSCELPENIEILKPCSQREALLAMQDFDVGLIPFKNNELTASVDPIKYYEYRALGLPVISSAFGEMVFRKNAEGVFLINPNEEIDIIINKSLKFKDNDQKIREFISNNTWGARFTSSKLL